MPTTQLSIIMPCLNEESTVASCVLEAKEFLRRNRLDGEVLVVDNGSTDGSADEARSAGARVVSEPRRGYGRALRTGLERCDGAVAMMGDCDTTYDFLAMGPLVTPLLEGRADLMVGDRFAGGMEAGAMPLSHRIGVPLLSLAGRARWHVAVRDFHCGLRGLTREAWQACTYRTDGMEFASEMIAQAALQGLRIGQAPVRLRRCRAERTSKLRTLADGWRHLRLMLTPG